jgi:hemolysin activation/secretion protein
MLFKHNSENTINKTIKFILFGLIFSSFFMLPKQVQANPTLIEIDAIQQIQSQERDTFLQQHLEHQPTVRLSVQPLELEGRFPEHEAPCFTINTIELNYFKAKTPLTNQQHNQGVDFDWILKYANLALDGSQDIATGRCLGTKGINLLVKRIQNSIVNKGLITTRIVVEPQDLTTGTLKLMVIPGRIHKIRFLEPKSNRATAWNAVTASTGDLLNLRDIEQSLENFKRVPTADADIQITPSTETEANPGDSDLIIDWKQETPFRVNLSLNDSGSESTGKYQCSFTFSYDNFLTLNDIFYITFNKDLGGGAPGNRGSRGHSIHYSIPLGYWSVAMTSNNNEYYQTIVGANQNYIYSGDSTSQHITLSRVMYRNAVRKTTLSIKGGVRTSKNHINDTEILVQRRRTFGLNLGLQHQEFIKNATLNVSLNYRRGYKGYGALDAPEEAFNEGTARPDILTSQIQLHLPFTFKKQFLSYSTFLSIQTEGTRLVPQDKFSIGGRYTVRGFDGKSQLSAERGWLLRNDLTLRLGKTGQNLYLGVDYGSVSGRSSNTLSGKELGGAVIGLKGHYKMLSYDVFIGKPLLKPNKFTASDIVSGFTLNAYF